MRFQSTRNPSHAVGLSDAIARGLAPDGGLYVPEALPRLDVARFAGAASLAEVAERLIAPFAAGDAMADALPEITRDAFNFPAPLVDLRGAGGPLSVLELFHGPTAAFKDFGARFLAATLERIPRDDPRRLTILVATSGDTGGAVAAAFYDRPWVDVVVLYPRGLVSVRQEKQLACWGRNVRTLSVAGTFDDCQRMVKDAFVDPALAESLLLSSANSINVGRLLPQMVYYAKASLELQQADGRAPNFIIPTGNLGNALACIWAREAGLPIGEILLASNANRTVPEFLGGGEWRPLSSSGAGSGGRARASLRWRPRWTSATRATWNACACYSRTRPGCAPGSPRCRSATTRSATRSGATTTSSARPGARTPRRPPVPTAACRCNAAPGAGCWWRRRIPRSSTTSSSH